MVVQIEKSRGVGNIEVKAHIHSEQNTFQNVTKASVASKVFECKYIKYVGVQSRKAVHLPTLEIRVEQKGNRVKKNKAAATGNRTQNPSITDQMSVLTNQVHFKIQFRHRFDQK